MRLHDKLRAAEVRWRPVRGAPQQLGQRKDSSRDFCDPRIIRQKLGRVAAPDREAGGFQPDHWCTGRDVRMQDVERPAQLSPSALELAGADPGQAAAGWSFHELRRVASRHQHRDGCRNRITGKEVRERVDPDNDAIT